MKLNPYVVVLLAWQISLVNAQEIH
jgi:hypothetical protein